MEQQYLEFLLPAAVQVQERVQLEAVPLQQGNPVSGLRWVWGFRVVLRSPFEAAHLMMVEVHLDWQALEQRLEQ